MHPSTSTLEKTINDFTANYLVDQTPEDVFAAIINVRGWWTGDIEGKFDAVGDEFTYCYPDAHYSKQKITELIPGKKVVWRVVDSKINGPEDPSEWTGTEITFKVSRKGEQTEVAFAHVGLVPEFECFDSCSNAWGFYVNGNLKHLITTGDGPMAPPWA